MSKMETASKMTRLLRKLVAFTLLLELLGDVRLSVLIASVVLAAGVVVFTHFLLEQPANSP